MGSGFATHPMIHDNVVVYHNLGKQRQQRQQLSEAADAARSPSFAQVEHYVKANFPDAELRLRSGKDTKRRSSRDNIKRSPRSPRSPRQARFVHIVHEDHVESSESSMGPVRSMHSDDEADRSPVNKTDDFGKSLDRKAARSLDRHNLRSRKSPKKDSGRFRKRSSLERNSLGASPRKSAFHKKERSSSRDDNHTNTKSPKSPKHSRSRSRSPDRRKRGGLVQTPITEKLDAKVLASEQGSWKRFLSSKVWYTCLKNCKDSAFAGNPGWCLNTKTFSIIIVALVAILIVYSSSSGPGRRSGSRRRPYTPSYGGDEKAVLCDLCQEYYDGGLECPYDDICRNEMSSRRQAWRGG